MKQFVAACTAAVMTVGMAQASFAAADKAKLDDRLNSARVVVDEIMNTPDKGIPQSILAGASCVVVVPHYKKAHSSSVPSTGRVLQRAAPVMAGARRYLVQLTGGSFGWQIGGSSTDLVLVAMNHDGLDHMLHNKFKLGADAAASAGPVGRDAQAGTDWKLNAEFLTYSRQKGLFAGLDLSGTVLSQNEDDTRTVYGANIPFPDVLKGGIPTPAEARPFVHTVAHYFVVSKQNH